MNDALRQAIFEAAVRQLRDERAVPRVTLPLVYHPQGFAFDWPMPERCQEWTES